MDFSVNRSPLKTGVSRRVISFSDIFGGELYFRMQIVSFFDKKFHIFSVTVPKGEKVIVINASILLAWCYFVGLGLFQSPSCRYLQKTLPFLLPLQPNGFGDNRFH